MATPLTVVLVEDHEIARDELAITLARQGWQILGADCGEELNRLLREHRIDIAVLDVNLPYEDGFSIAARLRVSHPDMGLIMLTARTRPGDRLSGYRSGADVYMTKPVFPEELIAVIENVAARMLRDNGPDLVLDRQRLQLVAACGNTCQLTVTEMNLLELLMLMPERSADAEYLLSALSRREDQGLTRDNLTVLVSRLRSKAARLEGVPNLISALRGYGYRLNLPLILDRPVTS